MNPEQALKRLDKRIAHLKKHNRPKERINLLKAKKDGIKFYMKQIEKLTDEDVVEAYRGALDNLLNRVEKI